LLVGQGQRLTGVDPLRGSVRWEVPLANPRGTNEVERVADLVGPLSRAREFDVGTKVYTKLLTAPQLRKELGLAP